MSIKAVQIWTVIADSFVPFSVSISTAMHDNILDERQRYLAPRILHKFKDFYLWGGTAIALHIGHRKSIDFDLSAKG